MVLKKNHHYLSGSVTHNYPHSFYSMSLACNTTPNQVAVNLYGQTSVNGDVINIWKVQKAPEVNVRVNQRICFKDSTLKGQLGSDLSGTRAEGIYYEGEVLGVAVWERH